MSRVKKSRSLKRVTGGQKTGSKERMKLETKQRKAKKKAANPRAVVRQRSVFQKLEDEKKALLAKGTQPQKIKATPLAPASAVTPQLEIKKIEIVADIETDNEDNLWDMLEQPQNTNTF